MLYLSKEQIMLIHSLVVDETGGAHGVRDLHLIASLENLPQQTFGGKELYPSVFIKAAVYLRNIIMNHPFIDGNKRTGMSVAAVFLENNGYKLKITDGEIEKFALRVISDKLDLEPIANWLKANLEK
jgi:death-on-curing protein